jgi:cholesterol transport system auxiliary component
MRLQAIAGVAGLLALSACSSVFETNAPNDQTYVLRAASSSAASVPPEPARSSKTLHVSRPSAAPGLESDRIALIRADRSVDFYAGARWAGDVPALVEALLVDTLRSSGSFRAVFGDGNGVPSDFELQLTIRRFEAAYTGAGDAPVIQVAIDGALSRVQDRSLVTVLSVSSTQAADANRLSAVVAAFEAAAQRAATDLARNVDAALQNVDSPDASIKR